MPLKAEFNRWNFNTENNSIFVFWKNTYMRLKFRKQVILHYTTLTNFSTKYLVMCKVYTDVGGIK